jgi:hypothetical protein
MFRRRHAAGTQAVEVLKIDFAIMHAPHGAATRPEAETDIGVAPQQ